MRIILHAGMPKAGSTALQMTLKNARARLLRRGVLYPDTTEGHQNFAIAGVVGYRRLPRGYRRVYADKQDTLECDFKKYWNNILSQIGRYGPHTLVLSGEAFYRSFSEDEIDKLNKLLRPLAEQVKVVIYARRPSEYYLSSVQQGLRASHKLKPIRPISYRATIEPYLNYIADELSVIPFVRNELYGRDIALDFASRFIPDCLEEVSASAAGPTNETVSAEAMSILQSYRSQNHADRVDIHTADTSTLLDVIRDVERNAGLFSRPQLKPELIDTIDRLSGDVRWLKDKFDISYDGLAVREGELPTINQPQTVEEICQVDFDKRDRLLMLVLQRLLADNPYYEFRIGRYLRSLIKFITGGGAKKRRLPDKSLEHSALRRHRRRRTSQT